MNAPTSAWLNTLPLGGATGTAVLLESGSPEGIVREARLFINQAEEQMKQHPYLGMWVTADGHVRQELLPNGRYDEARGTRQSAYQGRYEVEGNRIDYWDDTGFTADGVFVDADTLQHGGMVFYRQK